jgi:hypothetical protein
MPDSVKALGDRPAAATPGGGTVAAEPAAAAAASGPPAGAPCPLPETLQPQLATLVDEPPADAGDWIFEIKFDGYRMLARVEAASSNSSRAMQRLERIGFARWRKRCRPWSCRTAGTTVRSSCRASACRPTSKPCRRLRFEPHRRHRLLPVRPAVLRRLRPARGAGGGTARRAARILAAQAARQGSFQRGVRCRAAGLLQSACQLGWKA